MSNPLVSIIIPVFNRVHLIGETLDSVLAQTYTNWECIIVDDGSTDDTDTLLTKYCEKDSRFQYHHRPKGRPKGANACRNYGFEISKGSYIQWFDSDDLMHKNKLMDKLNFLQKSTANFVVCEGIEYKDTLTNVIHDWNSIFSNNPLLDHITGKINFHTNGPLFKRAFLEEKKLFNEELQRKQEWEFYTRLLTFSTYFIPLNKVLFYFRAHEDSINGKNEISTLKSRIKATNLVFKNVKSSIDKESLQALRIYFLRKNILFFKLAKNSNDIKLVLYTIKSIFIIFNFKMFVEGFVKLLYHPKILNNIFR